MSDDEVIERVLAGDVASFRALVERHERRLFGFIRRFLPAGDCADVAQDVFLSAYRNLASYRAEAGRFSTWLLAMARNRCLNVLARRGPAALGGPGALPEPIDPRTPDAALEEAEFFARLDAALAALPLEQRTAFVLAELHGLSLAEISRIEAVGIGTVKSRLSRARAKLREQWAREDESVKAKE
jgi:RNA polymerase sigma-70 factor (ECF subfamily)